VREWARNPKERILLIAPTASDVREIQLEGPSGLLNCYPPGQRPDYNPSRHLLTFPSGAIGFTRSAEEPERLRGPQFTKFWADEIGAWSSLEAAWDQIMFGFRLPDSKIQGVITTTPKPLKIIRELLANPSTVITRGSSYDNRGWLSSAFFESVIKRYEGTRLGRQEINAELLDDTPGALWTLRMIDAHRIRFADIQSDKIVRIVIAIDPAVSAEEGSDETGIIVAALVKSGHVLIIEDLSCKESPLGWARIIAEAYFRHKADRVVAEVNNGGDLVEANLRAAAPNVAFRKIWASRGKLVRAEPVATLYERGMVHHVGPFQKLEDQLCSYVPGVKKSPDRMDALVFAVTELAIDEEQKPYRIQMGEMVQISPI